MKWLIFLVFFSIVNLSNGQIMNLKADVSVLPVITQNCGHSGFGREVVISDSMAVVGAANFLYGSAIVFNKDAMGNWVNSQTISPGLAGYSSSNVGSTVDIGSDYLVLGADEYDYDEMGSNFLINSGAAYIFMKDTSGNWVEHQKIVASNREGADCFGRVVSVSGDFIFVSAPLLKISSGAFSN